MHPALYEKSVNDRLIRKFTDEKIQSAIEDAMRELDHDTPVATVAHWYMDDTGRHTAKLSVVTRLGDDVTVQAAAYADWGGGRPRDLGAGARVVWTP